MGTYYSFVVFLGAKVPRKQFEKVVEMQRCCSCSLSNLQLLEKFCCKCRQEVWHKPYTSYDYSKFRDDDWQDCFKSWDVSIPANEGLPIFVGEFLTSLHQYDENLEELNINDGFKEKLLKDLKDEGVEVEDFGLYCFVDWG